MLYVLIYKIFFQCVNEETKDGGRFVDILVQSESKGNFMWNLHQL